MVKSSHALADGLGSIALFAMLLFDVTEEPQREDAAPWTPRPLPTREEFRAAASPADNEGAGATAGAGAGGLLDRAAAIVTNPQQIRDAA